MKHNTLLLLTAVLYLCNAAITLTAPSVQLSLYGVTAGPGGRYMAQWAGLGSLAVGLLALALRTVTERRAQRAATLALTVYFVVGAALSVLGTISGIMRASAWSLVAVQVLFAVAYGYPLTRRLDMPD